MEKGIYSTFETAKLCAVDISTVINWVEKGILPAFRTPGGHRRIKRDDLLKFLKEYKMPVPEKLDSKLKILIVDDDENMLEIINIAFRKLEEPVDMFVAKDGFQAGKLIAEEAPDLLIIDLVLPKMDGFDIIKSLRSDTKMKDMKIIVITGYDTYANKDRLSKEDIDAYFVKPFKIDELKKKVNKLLFQ